MVAAIYRGYLFLDEIQTPGRMGPTAIEENLREVGILVRSFLKVQDS